MKNRFRNYLTVVALIFTFLAVAQAPQKMSYQSVIRNNTGDLVANSPIGLRISILKDSPTGTVVYSETMTNTTNENGLLSIEIGGGTPITGTFAGIDWSTGTFFIKTETDPNGGANYDVVGTSQLLSVPYALYAEKSKNLGKSTIILADDITDAEAAAQIAIETGPNTETVIITNTDQLTTVDLSSITSLINLDISGNLNLISVNLSNLSRVHREISIAGNPQMNSINLNSLSSIPKTFFFSSNGVQSLNFPSVVKFTTASFTTISFNPNLVSINFPVLNSLGINSDLYIQNNGLLTSFLTPLLINGSNNSTILLTDNSNLSTVNFNSLVSGRLTMTNNKISSLSLPLMTSGSIQLDDEHTTSISCPMYSNGGGISLSNTLITTLSLPSAQTNVGIGLIGNSLLTSFSVPNLSNAYYILIQNSPQLTSISFPSLTFVESWIQIYSNASLNSISFPLLNTINADGLDFGPYFDMKSNALPSAQINSLLNKLTTVNSNPDKTINLSNQNPPAPPTGQGIIDKQTLINNGFNVITD